jgi:hypothetical protein
MIPLPPSGGGGPGANSGMVGFHHTAPPEPVAQHLVGYRAWTVNITNAIDPQGRILEGKRDSFARKIRGGLYGLTHSAYLWGETNTAECGRQKPNLIQGASSTHEDYVRKAWDKYLADHANAIPPIQSCGCGFWAYADARYVPARPFVWGVIHGWGRMVAGPKGFRCQHARIVAVSVTGQSDETLEQVRREILVCYPHVALFDDVDAMMNTYPATDLRALVGNDLGDDD